MPAAPKPPKQKKAKGRYGICPSCGSIFRGLPYHTEECSHEFEVIQWNTSKTEKQRLEAALEVLIKAIIGWRDGGCIEAEMDGVRCGGELQWGHVLARNSSAWMKYDLCHTVQCANHNFLEKHGDPTMKVAFDRKFGHGVFEALWQEAKAHRNQERGVVELREMLTEYNNLWDNHMLYGTGGMDAVFMERVQAGFYGSVIAEAMRKEVA